MSSLTRCTIRVQKRRPRASLLLLWPVLAIADICTLSAQEIPAEQSIELSPEQKIELLLTKAQKLHLAHNPDWLTLLHYDSGLLGHRGLIDDAKFYLAADGKRDPQAELLATLKGLWQANSDNRELSVAARFPARAAFLSQRLGFSLQELPVTESAELAATLKKFTPQRAWIIFPTGYLASPASMFGHTFILIQGDSDSLLLAQAISYGADTTGAGPLAVVLGLTGGFRGYFTVLPYHRKVQEYTDLDQRDIWEYPLNFTPEEITRLLHHAWELRGIGSDYWFFDENCSFNLLYLLDAARPGLSLHRRAGPWVMPSETIRWMQEAGIVGPARYRPSRATTVQFARQNVSPAIGQTASNIAQGQLSAAKIRDALPQQTDHAIALDLAGEMLHALAGRQAITLQNYRTRLHDTLTTRAALGKQSPLPTPIPPAPPDQAHRPLRLGIGGGYDDDSHFTSLSIRAAQHDVLDRADGYVPGSALTFGEITLRWYEKEDDDTVRIQQLDAVRVSSLAPYESLFKRWSWTASGGIIDERMNRDGERHYHSRLGGGAGVATTLGTGTVWGLALMEGRAFGVGTGYAVAGGGQIGVLHGIGPLRYLASATGYEFFAGWQATNWQLDAGMRFGPHPRWAIDLIASRYARWDHLATGIEVRLLGYF
jgi:Domain of unknown function (DUF4105)